MCKILAKCDGVLEIHKTENIRPGCLSFLKGFCLQLHLPSLQFLFVWLQFPLVDTLEIKMG